MVAALEADPGQLFDRARRLADELVARGVRAEAVHSVAAVGGGGAPGVELPSAAVALPEDTAEALRAGRPAVLGRVHEGRCLLDLRALPAADDPELLGLVIAAVGRV